MNTCVIMYMIYIHKDQPTFQNDSTFSSTRIFKKWINLRSVLLLDAENWLEVSWWRRGLEEFTLSYVIIIAASIWSFSSNYESACVQLSKTMSNYDNLNQVEKSKIVLLQEFLFMTCFNNLSILNLLRAFSWIFITWLVQVPSP